MISSLSLKGLADNVDQLRAFGVEAQLQGDKVVIQEVVNVDLREPSPFAGGRQGSAGGDSSGKEDPRGGTGV